MNLIVLKRFLSGFFSEETIEEIEIELKGEGTKENPLIIDSSNILPKAFEIYENNLFILIKNCSSIEYLGLHHSKNVLIENCHFKYFTLNNCANVEIRTINAGNCEMQLCENISLFNSNIGALTLDNSHNNFIKNCSFNYFFNPGNFSKANTLDNNIIPEEFLEELTAISSPRTDFNKPFFLYSNVNRHEFTHNKKGNYEEPIIIDNINNTIRESSFFSINNNRFHVILRDFYLDKVEFFNDKYISLENCRFLKYCFLRYCSSFHLKNVNTKSIKFGKCKDITIEDSNFGRIKTFNDFNGGLTFKNCKLNYVKKKIFDSCNFQNSEIQKVISNHSLKLYFLENKLVTIIFINLFIGTLLASIGLISNFSFWIILGLILLFIIPFSYYLCAIFLILKQKKKFKS